ncbi:MAG: Fe-S cluster assembly protein SufD [Thiotrichales bacterium]|nr:Fe-S cluster assembly protein SufD [Thiotrichales bacterium]
MTDVMNHFVQEHDRHQAILSGDSLHDLRRSALQQFKDLGFPTRRQENWKYTDVRKLFRQEYTLNTAPADVTQNQIDKVRYTDPGCHELVFINGVFSSAHSRLDELPDGVVLSDFSTAMGSHPDIVAQHLAQYSRTDINGFTALNAAFLNQGCVLILPDAVQASRPVHLLYINTGQDLPFTSQLRNLVVMGKNSQATLIESYTGLDDSVYFTNSVTEIALHRGSQLDHYRLQQESKNSFHMGNITTKHDEDSRYVSNVISMGAELSRIDLNCNLAGKGAETDLNGLYMVNGNQHTDHHIKIEHAAMHTLSNQNYRGILDGNSRAVFNGKVIVHEGADKTDARQANANLLMSDAAEVDTKPELEIYADDVKCSHGATVGQLDQQMLFYLQSRAIDKATARSLLTFAFADEVIQNIRFQEIRDRLESQVVGQLPDAKLIQEFTHE